MPNNGERILDIHAVSDKIGWSTRTIRRKVKRREFPTPFLFGKGWGWLQSDVDRWIVKMAAKNEIDPDSIPDDEKVPESSADNRGHSGTSAPGDQKPASEPKKSK